MTKLLREAITKVEKLPEAEQDRVAELLLGFGDTAQSRYRLTDEQLAEVDAARREAREGKFASDEAMVALWRKFDL